MSKRGDGETLPTGDDDVFAKLQRPACDAHDNQRLEDASLRSAQLVPEDHGDTQHELDLLLEGIEGLARHRADCEGSAQSGCDRSRAADRTGRCDTATCGTDQPQGQLIVGVGRVRGAKLIDFGSDRRLAALHGLIQGTCGGSSSTSMAVKPTYLPRLPAEYLAAGTERDTFVRTVRTAEALF